MTTASRNNSELQRRPFKVAATSLQTATRGAFEKFIKQLNGSYTENLTFDTNVLISSTVVSEKYRAACIINIPVVTSEWLVESVKNDAFLPVQNFLLPIFKGLRIGLLGFNDHEIKELETLIEKREGQISKNMNRIQEERFLNLIIIKKSEIRRHDSFIMSQTTPVVTPDWLKNCIIFNQYLIPKKYAINTARPSDRQSASQKLNDDLGQFHQLEGCLVKTFNEYEVGNDKYEYLEEIVIYFHNLPDKLEKFQKKLLNLAGGTYVKDVIPEVTHIITSEYAEDEVKVFHKYRQTKVVDIHWLKECFLFRRLIKEDDYLVHPVPHVLADLHNITPPNKTLYDAKPIVSLSRRNTMTYQPSSSMNEPRLGGRSASFTEMKTRSLSRSNSGAPSLGIKRNGTITEEDEEEDNDKKKDEGMDKTKGCKEGKENMDIEKSMLPPSHNPQKNSKSGKQSKPKKQSEKTIGYVFKNINVYFDPKYKEELANYKKLVRENSGKVLDSLNVFEEIFYILPDSEESAGIFRRNTKKNIVFVSYRWIDYCLRSKIIVRDFQEKKLVFLIPFPFKVPFADFSETTIYAAGLPPYDKNVIKEIIQLFGAKFAYEPSNLTVLVCQDISSKKYTEIKAKYSNVPIVNPNWVFDCLTKGKKADFEGFLIR